MEKKNLYHLLLILTLIYSISFISALDTKVRVTTYGGHDLELNFLNPPPGALKLFQNFRMSTGTGEVSIVFSSNELKFDITAFVMNGNQKVVYQRFNSLVAGEPIHLILFTGNTTLVKDVILENQTANQTIENTTTIDNSTLNTTPTQPILNETTEEKNDSEKKSSLTGMSTSEDEGTTFSNNIYYIIGGVILIILIILTAIYLRKRSKSPKEIKVRKLSELKLEKKAENYKVLAEKDERKILGLEKEVNALKSHERIKEIENRIREQQEEIRRLRGLR